MFTIMVDETKECKIILYKLINKEYDLELDDNLIKFMSENTILGKLARISKKLNFKNETNLCNNNESNNEISNSYLGWQFGDEDDK